MRNPFLKDPDPRVDAVIVRLLETKPGEILTYVALAREFGFDPTTGAGYTVCYNARKKLLKKHNVTTRAIENIGYKRLTDVETLHDGFRKTRILGQVRREREELKGIEFTALKEKDRVRFAARSTLNALIEAEVKIKLEKLVVENSTEPGRAMADAVQRSLSALSKDS